VQSDRTGAVALMKVLVELLYHRRDEAIVRIYQMDDRE
jgi:hypothetical protein